MVSEKKKRGRPRGKVRETHTVYLRLPTNMVDQVRVLAREKGWTVNRWVETVISNVIRRESPRLVLAPERHGSNGRDRSTSDGQDA